MTATTARPWRSGFCNPGNPADSHARCAGLFPWHDGPCCCACHDPAVEPLVVTLVADTRPPGERAPLLCGCWVGPVALHDGHCCFRSYDETTNRVTCGHDAAGIAAMHAAYGSTP